ncbi:hypothetical protein C8N31_11016 [Sulfitobacter mediterraneus]|uniref:Uncharacterized protein n=1 Tax=Sulfitobacter mediterraneus TaxID=83219 RepID=A0A2T6CB99_9RHOB|nr:hypothetical protein C8N31_11016 [Sulfitobacter mediterraneus]
MTGGRTTDMARYARSTQGTLGTAAEVQTRHVDQWPKIIRVGKKHNPRLEPENLLKQGETDAP